MIRVYLNGEEVTLPIGFDAKIFGTAASETINVAADTSIEFSAGDDDRINLVGNLADYEITSAGNVLTLEDEDGNVIRLGVTGTSTIGFADGSAELSLEFEGGVSQMLLGGAVVPGDGETVVDPDDVALDTDDPGDPGDPGDGDDDDDDDDPGVPGDEYELTVNADRGSAFVGTEGNDVYEAPYGVNSLGQTVNTLQSADSLDGGGGDNELWATVMMESSVFGGAREIAASTNNIQELYFTAVESGLSSNLTIGDVLIGNFIENFGDIYSDDDVEIDIGGRFDPDITLNLPAQSEIVHINAVNMLDVEYIESYRSNEDLTVYGLTTNKSDGGTTNLNDITISMDHTSGTTADTGSVLQNIPSKLQDNFYAEYINGMLKASSMKVLFEQNYLVPGTETTESIIQYALLDQLNHPANPLDEFPLEYLRFEFDGGGNYTVPVDRTDMDAVTQYAQLVALLNASLDDLRNESEEAEAELEGVYFELSNLQFTDPDGRVGTWINLVDDQGRDFAGRGTGLQDDAETGNIYYTSRDFQDAQEFELPISINIELEKVGRGEDGGGLVVGGDNYTKGFDEFDVTVRGDSDEPSSLAYLLTTPHGGLDKITIYTHEDDLDDPADLTIGNSNTPVYSIIDVEHFDATQFAGTLELYYAVIQTPDQYTYELGSTGDTLSLHVVDDALNTQSSSLFINAGAGENTVHVDYEASNGSQGVNTNIFSGNDDDTVVLSNMGPDFVTSWAEFAGQSGADFPLSFDDIFALADSANSFGGDAARIETGAGDDAIFLNGHSEICNVDTASYEALYGMGTPTEELLDSIGLTNVHPWWSVENWAPAGNVFPIFNSRMQVTFAGIESAWVTIPSSEGGGYFTTYDDLIEAMKDAIEGDVNLSHLLAVDDDAPGGGIRVDVLAGGQFGAGDLSVEIQGPNASLNQFNWPVADADYDPQDGSLDFLHFPGLPQGGIAQVTAQQLAAAWNAYYPGSNVTVETDPDDDVEWESGEVLSDYFDNPGTMTEFLAAVQENATFIEDIINLEMNQASQTPSGDAGSSGIQFVNAGSGHDTIVLPDNGITTVEFTGPFNTTTIVSDGNLGNLNLDFSSYLDMDARERGQSLNPTLEDGDNVQDGFVPIPVVSSLNVIMGNNFSGIETGSEWNNFGGGQHNSISYFDFSNIWDILVNTGTDTVDPPSSFANFTGAQLQSALNEVADVRAADDYQHFIFGNENLGFDEDVSVVGAQFVILVGKDGEVIQEYGDGNDTDYPDFYAGDWDIDTDYATGEMKVFTGVVGQDGDDLVFSGIQEMGVVNLATTGFDFDDVIVTALA